MSGTLAAAVPSASLVLSAVAAFRSRCHQKHCSGVRRTPTSPSRTGRMVATPAQAQASAGPADNFKGLQGFDDK